MFDVGTRIREIRKQNKMTMQELSKRIGLTQPQLSRIENNQNMAQLDTLFNICKVFNITLSDFFIVDGTSEPLHPQLKTLLDSARELTPEQLQKVTELIQVINSSVTER